MGEFVWNDRAAIELAQRAGFETLHNGAELILTEAIDETPLDTGTLRRSGTVTDNKTRLEVYVSFNTPYAVEQHENLWYKHKDGKAKYLEDPFNRLKSGVLEKVKNKILQALQSAR